MEQEDYLLREIEKIGTLLKMIFDKIAGKGGNRTTVFQKQIEDAKGLLVNETGFDINLFVSLKESEMEQYIFKFQGINSSNIELLADVIKVIGMSGVPPNSKKYLRSALKLYDFCSSSDKTFSVERQNKIVEVSKLL
jgi:hypothetical protein